MLYVLILTTYLTASSSGYPGNAGQSFAVAQTSTTGFQTEKACLNAGEKAVATKPPANGYERLVTVTFQCSPMNI